MRAQCPLGKSGLILSTFKILFSVLSNKAVFMPGHHDAGNEYTSIEDAVEATRDAKQQGLGGT